ncbi:type I methionyl aminopeptidase [Patescibacteria group bacterium]
MIIIKSHDEIDKMREGGKILSSALQKVIALVRPGISSLELDAKAYDFLLANGGKPAFKNYQGYPSTLCVSINSEVVHGIPSQERILKDGDIVGLDLGLLYKGLYTDMAETVPVGEISKKAHKLITVTRKALQKGISVIKPQNTLGDVGSTIQSFVEKNNFGIVRSLVGHGVGKAIHEEPAVPNFGEAGTGIKLQEGMTLALEPMVTEGDYPVKILDDKWTVVTQDGGLSAHFERTIVVTSNGSEILTPL